jgi:hypothetical protein
VRLSDGSRNAAGLRTIFVDIFCFVVLIAWSVSFLVDIFNPRYDPPAPLHGLMVAVSLSALGTNRLVKFIGKDDEK